MMKWKKILSVLIAAAMLLSMPITAGFARTYAESADELDESFTPDAPEAGQPDLSTLHVQKLGEITETPAFGNGDDIDPNEIVRVSIFLKGKSALDRGYSLRGMAGNRRVAEYRKELKKTQDELQTKIEKQIGHKINVKWNLTLAANAISAEIPYKDLAGIRAMAGVESVVLERRYEAPRDAVADHPNTANTSVNMVGATNAWSLGYTGAGSRVAIIDTGLDIDHQSVAEAPFLYSIDELSQTTGKTYSLFTQEELDGLAAQLNSGSNNRISAKIAYAYNYVDRNEDVTHLNDTQGEHGSHVAGISAANKYLQDGDGYVLSANAVDAVGMAPDAQLFIMKVFGANGGAYDSDYMVAIEDAIVMDCDVVNLSLGSSVQGWTFSEQYQSIMNKIADQLQNEGMVVSISAGNSYSLVDMMEPANIARTGLYIEDINMHTGGSPGTYVNSLCVAAAQNTLTKGLTLLFDSDSTKVFYAESLEGQDGTAYGNAPMTSVSGTQDYIYIDTVGEAADFEAVNAVVPLTGKVLIVNRGSISFYEKGNNAKKYNPKAVIIANNAEGVIHMALDGYEGTFPMVSIMKADADRIKANDTADNRRFDLDDITYYTGTMVVGADIEISIADREDTTITDFSSWGAPGSLLMKPEITAPGGDILSIWGTNKTSSGTAGGTDQYELMSGTSMAAPHITGLAAVVAQYLRENGWLKDTTQALYNEELTAQFSARAINQSLMMSLATPMKNNGKYLSILQQGAGLVEINNAVTAPSVVMIDGDASYLTGDTGAAADGKVKVELGDDPEKTGVYTYKFDIFNITDYPLTYSFRTDIFSQERVYLEEDGYHMAKTTTLMPLSSAAVTHSMKVVGSSSNDHDVNKDGYTNEFDAQAILDYLSGENDGTDLDLRLSVADVDEDEAITTHDAQLLLENATATLGSDTVPPHSKGTVTVTITLNAGEFGAANYPCGAYIEGFTYASCTSTYNDGTDEVSLAHEHSIPILGFYGSWTNPSMFDAASYTDGLYHPNGEPKSSYTGNQDTNYMTMTMNGTKVKFAGNPYMVEDSFPADRLAINSNSTINSIVYNLYRAAAATGFAVTEIDANGDNSAVKAATVSANSVSSIYFNAGSGAWQNTATKSYTVNKTPADYGFAEGDTFRVGFYAIPEYNAMKQNDSYDQGDSATVDSADFTAILMSNTLGKGAFVGYDFTVDNTPPVITGITDPTVKLVGTTLEFDVSDNKGIAYVAILSLDGNVKYYEVAPGTTSYHAQIDVTNAINSANGYIAVFAGDYAGNEAATYKLVNDNASTQKEVYVKVNAITAGNDYLIVNTASTGIGKGLYYTSSTTLGVTSRDAAAFDAIVLPGIPATNGQVYIESADIPETGIWTAGVKGEAFTFMNSESRYVSHLGTVSDVTFDDDDSRADWNWSGNNSRLYFHYGAYDRYLQYADGNFKIDRTKASVYLYEKRTITINADPVHVTSISLTPDTLELYVGNTAALTANILPLSATNRSIIWSSDNGTDPDTHVIGVADVDQNGVVTATKPGVAHITAQSADDNTVLATCTVTVTAITKQLNAFIADAQGAIHPAQFTTQNPVNGELQWLAIPNDDDLGDSINGHSPLINAYQYNSSTMYATTNNFTGNSYIYTVNTSDYTLSNETLTYVAPFGLAEGPNNLLYGDCATFGFAYFLLSGPVAEVEEGEGALLPIGMLDTSETDVGGAYIASVCLASTSGRFPSYYFLDETGKIWKTTMKQSDTEISSVTDILVKLLTYSFTDPVLVVDTGIGTSFENQNIYYDGSYIYWSHTDGDTCELLIIEPNSGKVYHAGNFGADVWPVGGMSVFGSTAPAAVGDGDHTMEKEIDPMLPELMRERIMTPEIMARMQAEAEKNASKAVPSSMHTSNGIRSANAASVPGAVRLSGNGDGTRVFRNIDNVNTTEADGKLVFRESENTTNGLFTLTYPANVTYAETVKGDAENLFISVHHDPDMRTVRIAYAKKGAALTGDDTIATVQFNTVCEDATVNVTTVERNTSYAINAARNVTLLGIGHDWGEVTYTWNETLNGSGNAPTYTVTAARVCANDPSHIESETVATTCVNGNSEWTYTTEAFDNPAFTQQTRTVSKLVAVTVTSSGNGTTVPGSTVALVTGGGSFAPGATTQLIAPAVAGYTFLGWYPVNGAMPADRITEQQTFAYTVKADGNDLIAVYEPQTGATFRLTVTGTRFTIQENVNDTVTTQRSRYDDYYTAGSTVTITYTGSDNFLYWINSNKKIVCTDPSYTFVLMANTDIDAVYSEQNPDGVNHEALVLFVSSQTNGQVISQRYYTDTEPIIYPVAPVRVGRTFVGWDKTEEQIHAAMATETRIRVYPIYQSDGNRYTTTIAYWIGDTYRSSVDLAPEVIGTSQYISAEATFENEPFSYWADEAGNILGYNCQQYNIVSTDDITVRAVYGVSCVPEPVVRMTNAYATQNGSDDIVNFTATWSITDAYTVTQAGMLYAGLNRISLEEAEECLTLDYFSNGAKKNYILKLEFTSTSPHYAANAYFKTTQPARQFIARAYVVIENNDTHESIAIYSDNVIYASYNELVNKVYYSINLNTVQ